jgi:putative oxidoreductase
MLSDKSKSQVYSIFRILIGFAFLLHGGQKLLGWFGGPGGNGAVELISLMGLAGVIELIGGLLIFLGFYTSLVSSVAALEMLVAYFMAHIPNGLLPIVNGGESAFLFFASFLVLAAYGSGRFSLDNKFRKKRK